MRPATNQTRFTVPGVFSGWLACFFVANLAAVVVVAASGHTDTPSDELPTWVTLASLIGLWVPFVALLLWFSRTAGTGSVRDDYKFRFRPIDLIGLPIGVLGQLVLVPLVYWPLETAFPDTFADDRIEERARELWDRAEGGWLVLLVLLIAVGAPLIEELVYRGLVQQTLQSRLDDTLAIVVASAFFAAIHFQPIELPGLFAIALVFGVCFARTGRLGMSVLAHVGFNAVGLAVAAGA